MTKRLGKRLSALWACSAVLLLVAVALGAFAPTASAHSATKQITKTRTECSYETRMVLVTTYKAPGKAGAHNKNQTYKQERVRVCEKVPYTATISRPHIHVTNNVCYWVAAAGATSGTAATKGNPYGAIVGGAAGYQVCQLLPSIIWLG